VLEIPATEKMREIRRKPDWLKVRLPNTPEFNRVRTVLADFRLHSVCQEARCPNIAECFHSGTATFLILGDICTRNCGYCNVRRGTPAPLDKEEPERIAAAVKTLGIIYAVITSVTRDDLPDGGAEMFARCIKNLRREVPGCKVEVLIPDLQGNWNALDVIMAGRPDVINHNIEVVKPLFASLRPRGNYQISIELLQRIREFPDKTTSKTGFMIGFGEGWNDILDLLRELSGVGCERLTIGQYQQPNRELWPVKKYYHPDEFETLKQIASQMGFKHVESGPLVRSSYHAAMASKQA
jgi:lipoic acid synthetase